VNVLKKPTNLDNHRIKEYFCHMVRTNLSLLFTIKFFNIFLLGVGPIIDCEIDDDGEEPDYLSKNKSFKKNNNI